MNGVALAPDAPSVAAELHDAGYKTALIGKAHFEPFLDPFGLFIENQLASLQLPTIDDAWPNGRRGPHRGFDHLEFATHGAVGPLHYAKWLFATHPEMVGEYFAPLDGELNVSAVGGGDSGAPQVKLNSIPREWYHTDWVAERTIAWLKSLSSDDDWFCWMSFPDPHHPWDPPASEISRVPWRDVDLPENYPESAEQRESLLDQKARHWRAWYDGRVVSNYEAPAKWVPATLTANQVREVNALNAVEVELIDEAVGRVLSEVDALGWTNDLDVFFTTDHGELQGDFGLLFKGPYHVDALMRLPLIWRPAPVAQVTPAVVDAPVNLVSLASTFMSIAGLATPSWVEGTALPVSNDDARERHFEASITEWDSALFGVDVHVRTVVTSQYLYSEYQRGTMHDGTEGELYVLADDPLQRVNRFDDPALASARSELSERLRTHMTRENQCLELAPVVAPV